MSSEPKPGIDHFEYFLGECQRTGRVYQTLYELFVLEPEISIPLMNKLAPGLFSQILKIFRERLYLGIARLTDPKKTGKFGNLSALGVVDAFEGAGYDVKEMQKHARRLVDFSENNGLKTLRNKTIAHLDEVVILDGDDLPIPGMNELPAFFEELQCFVEEASILLGFEVTVLVFDPLSQGYGEQLFDWLETMEFGSMPEDSRRHRNTNRLPPCFRGPRKI